MPSFDDDIAYFAETTHRDARIPFGIRRRDRRHHMYFVGKTGVGKSTALKTLVAQDLERGEGLALFDPHGDLAEEVVKLVPDDRQGDLVFLDLADRSPAWVFNPFSGVPVHRRALATAGLIDVFKKMWAEDWGPRLEHLLRNVVLTLLETPRSTFADIPRLVTDKDFRRPIVRRLENREVAAFWRGEFEEYSPRFRAVVTAPLLNKISGFLTDPILRRILTGDGDALRLRKLMNEDKLLVVNLAKGQVGDGPATLLGSLLVSYLALAGLSRADTPEHERRDFYLYLDEFQTFSTLSLATMLSELRKYRLCLILAHQYLSQLDRDVSHAVLGNAGTIVSFRLGAQDAPLFAREFAPKIEPEHLVNLPNFNCYVRLMIDRQVSKVFSAETLAELPSIRSETL